MVAVPAGPMSLHRGYSHAVAGFVAEFRAIFAVIPFVLSRS
jgi:hypothetical protein